MSNLNVVVALNRIDPDENAYRFYVLSIEPNLFEEVSLIREWGRIGRPGRSRADLFETRAQAQVSLNVWLKSKLSRGYESV